MKNPLVFSTFFKKEEKGKINSNENTIVGDNVISRYKGNQSSRIERTSDLQYYTK